MGGQHHAPAALPPGRRPGTEGWVGTRASLNIIIIIIIVINLFT